MKLLTLLVGPPGSGKSTLAKSYVAGGMRYINQDSQGRDHLQLFTDAITAGKSIVVDRMGFSKAQRDRYLQPAKDNGYTTEIVVLHQPYSVCLERIRARKDHETIKDEQSARGALSTFFGKYERPQPGEADKIEFVYPEGRKPPAIVCDLDGTLCAIDHRLHFVRRPKGEKKDWKGFFDGIAGDEVNKWCADIVTTLSDKYAVVYCSGRPDNYRRETETWLNDNGLLTDNDGQKNVLYMRPRNDQRDDSIVKEIILDFEILTRFSPQFMIDDRKRVVDMWRKRGFTCLHCAEGDF